MGKCGICNKEAVNTQELKDRIFGGKQLCDECVNMIKALENEKSNEYQQAVIRAKRLIAASGEKNEFHYALYLYLAKNGRIGLWHPA